MNDRWQWRGADKVGLVYKARSLRDRNVVVGNIGDIASIIPHIPNNCYVVKSKLTGDYFFNYIVFTRSFGVSGYFQPFILGLCGYGLGNPVARLDEEYIDKLESGQKIRCDVLRPLAPSTPPPPIEIRHEGPFGC